MRKLTDTPCIFLLLSLLIFASCDPGFKRTESGLQYKIFKEGSGPIATAGSTVKLHYSQLLHDTVLSTTVGKLPYYKSLIPGTIFPYDPFEALTKGVRAGDSLVILQRIDSLLKKGKLKQLPSHLKSTDVLEVRMKILRVFPFELATPAHSDSLIAADKEAERRKIDSIQTILGPQRVEEYLKEKDIVASRTELGTYVETIQAGEGATADSGKTVQVKYKLTTLHGKVLDTNMDTSFHRKAPLQFEVGSGYMPRSVDLSIRHLKKGGHARIFVPAMVAIREMPNGGEQPSYEDMIFEIMVEDVL